MQRWHILPLNFQIVCFRFFFPATTQSNQKSSICGLQIVAWDQAPIGGKRRKKVGVGEFKKRTERWSGEGKNGGAWRHAMSTRIWYHGTAASKACLQAPPPFDMIPIPRPPLGSLGSPIFFPVGPRFCPFPPFRSLIPGYWFTLKKVLSVTKHGFIFWARRKPTQHLRSIKHFRIAWLGDK